MSHDVLAVRPDVSVGVVLRYLRMRRPLPVTLDALFVVDRRERFLGTIGLERLATAQLDRLAGDLVDEKAPVIAPSTSAREVAQLFADRNLTSLAVVGRGGRLLGRITSDDVVDVMRDEAETAMRRMGHLSADTDFFSGVLRTLAQRSGWLAFGLLAAAATGLLVAQFQNTIRSVGEVAALMPIVASLGGVFAVQTATITVRGLALGQVGAWNRARLLRREIVIAVLICSVLSIGLWAATAWWLGGALTLSAVVALGMTFIIAAAMGVSLPLLLQRIGLDPAFSTSAVTAGTDAIAYGTVLAVTAYVLA